MRDFECDWRRHYGDALPVAHHLRNAGVGHWLRFHSLPESKRYAETDAERSVILERQNTLGTEVLGDGVQCWLVQACFNTHEGPPLFVARDMTFVRHVADPDDPEDPPIDIYARRAVWTAGGFDGLLQAVSEFEAGFVLWMSTATGVVFAPYDGGVDLFLESSPAAQALAMKHADWLSAHPQGL